MKQQFYTACRQYAVKEVRGDGHAEWFDGLKSGFPSVKLLGKTEQQAYTGKNLFDTSRIPLNAMIKEVASDYIVISPASPYAGIGYTGANVPLKELAPDLIVGKQYVFRFDSESSRKFIYLAGCNQSWIPGTSKTITEEMLSSNVVFYAMSYNDGDPETDCRISNIQIEEGDTATAYEPYVGGIASPSPFYPQEVKANNATIQCTNTDRTYDGGEATAPNLLCAIDGTCQSSYDPQTGEFANWWWDKITLDGSDDEDWGPIMTADNLHFGFNLRNALLEKTHANAHWCNQTAPKKKGGGLSGVPELRCGWNNNGIEVYNFGFFDGALGDKGLANWKAYLAEHPLEVWVARNEPEITNIGPQRLTCPTGYGQIVQVAGDIPDCPLEVQYLTHGGNVK